MKTEVIDIDRDFPELEKIKRCAKIIRGGGLVVFPTETVYGIAADYSNKKAMDRLCEVKKRTEGKPFSIIISQSGLISNYTSMTDPKLYKLIHAHWPGPLTIVVPSKEEGQTVGIRMPDHVVALKLTRECQCPVAAPSANFEGSPAPTTVQEALKELDGLVDIAVDGGEARIGKGSTVIDIVSQKPALLREGAITQSEVDQVIGKKHILFVCTGNSCRSVMAEYLLRDMVHDRNDVDISSAGTGVFLHSAASAETLSVLSDEGIDARGHISQSINSILLKKSDLIFVMTQAHRQQVLDRVPSVENRVYLLREFSNIPASFHGDLDVPDPIGRSNQAYKECLASIKEAVIKIVDLV